MCEQIYQVNTRTPTFMPLLKKKLLEICMALFLMFDTRWKF